MADSLRDQLLKAGFSRPPRAPKPASPPRRKGKPPKAKTKPAGAPGEVDLARAYAMRAKAEARERRQAKAEAEAKARARKERLRKLDEVLQGKTLNRPEAEHLRHFEYGGKIRRVHVDADQREALNQGQLAVIQLRGRYVLVQRALAEQILTFAPEHVAVLIAPGTDTADAAADGVPDDLTW